MSVLVTQPREKILKIAQQIPASAQVLAQLGQLLMDVNSGLDEIARLLRRDTALAARIIRISNSAAYGVGAGVASIEDAVSRVGFAEVYRLTGFASAAQVFGQDLPFYGLSGPVLRANTLFTALAVEALAKRAGFDSRAAYTAGLMRSAGKVVLDRLGKQTMGAGQDFPTSGQGDLVAWEQSVFGTINTDVSGVILEAWHFPPAVVYPIREHYMQIKPSSTHARTSILLNIAAGISFDVGHALPGESGYWEPTQDKLRMVGLTQSAIQECTDEAKEAFEQVKSAID